jgi:hypothetical protein
MLKKIVIVTVPFLIVTILFLLAVMLFNRQGGKGALQVTSNAPAQVFLDSKFVGNTPLCLCELPQLQKVGDYNLKLVPTQKGLSDWQQKISIYQGALTVVDRTFDKSVSKASGSVITLSDIDDKNKSEIMIISFPSAAEIIMDSNNKGNTPAFLTDVTASDHEIKIIKDGYGEKDIKVKTIPGKRLQVTTYLGIRDDLTDQNATASASPTPTSTNAADQVVILDTPTGFLRVRQSPSVSSAEVEQVKPGDKFNIISEQDGWYQITLADGKSGWVSATYAKKQ